MSSITQTIATVFTARSGQALAAMRQYSSGLSSMGSNMQQLGRNSGYMNSQLRAIGTTLRYTFAGTMVFGLARMGTELSNIQTQLALMGSVGDVVDQAGQRVELTDQKLSNMLDTIQTKAPGALTNVNDLSAGVVNFLSSVQGFPEDQVVDTVSKIAIVAQMAQTPVDEMTKAVTGMNQAFGRDVKNPQNYLQLLRGILHVIQEAPGGISAGPEIMTQLAPLSAVSRLARLSPAEMLGGYLTVLRGGGSPSTAGRGFQYLVQSLAQPTKQGLEAQARAGITPQMVQERGGGWALRRMMEYAQGLGISGDINNLKGLTDEQLDVIESGGGAAGLGISGPGMQFLRESIGRIHGIRALALLMAQGTGPGGKLSLDQAATADFMKITQTNTDEFNKQVDDFVRRQPLKQMTNALISMRTQIEQDMQPLLNPIAQGTTWLATQGLKHQDATKGVEITLATLLGAYGLGRIIKGGRKGLPGAGGAGMLLGVSAIGQEGLGASPTNPMFVVVVGNMFGPGGGFNWGRNRPGAPGTPTPAPGGRGFWGRLRGAGGALARTAGRIGRIPGRLPFGAIGGAGAGAGIGYLLDMIFPEAAGGAGDIYANPQVAAQRLRQRGNLTRAQWLNPNVMQLYRAEKKQELFGRAEMVLDVLIKQPDGKVVRKPYHVPMDIWTGGPTPGNRGKAGKKG